MEQLCWKGREPAEPQHYARAHSCSALLRQSYKALSLGQSRLFPGFSTQVFWCGKVQCNTVFVIFHLLLWSVKQLSPAVELELSFSALRAEAPAPAQRCLVLPTTTQTETPGWWDCKHPTLSFNSSYPHLQSLKKTALLKERHHLLLHLLHVIQLTDHQRPQNSIVKKFCFLVFEWGCCSFTYFNNKRMWKHVYSQSAANTTVKPTNCGFLLGGRSQNIHDALGLQNRKILGACGLKMW